MIRPRNQSAGLCSLQHFMACSFGAYLLPGMRDGLTGVFLEMTGAETGASCWCLHVQKSSGASERNL